MPFENATQVRRCTAICISVQIMAKNWKDELQQRTSKWSFGGEGKNETVSGKGDDGAAGGGESRALLWTYILFSQGRLYLSFHDPQSLISRPAAALLSAGVWAHWVFYCILCSLRICWGDPPIYYSMANKCTFRDVQRKLESGAEWPYFTQEWVLFPQFSHLRWRKWLIGI